MADFAEEAPAVFGSSGARPPRGAPADRAGWSVIILSISETEPELARINLDRVRTRGGLPDAFLEKRGKTQVIAYGKYDSPTNPRAQSDLDRIRSIEIDGSNPFATAILAPPPYEALPGSVPDYDLSTLKQRMGGGRAAYTLQVAIYGRTDTKQPTAKEVRQFRDSAERAVVQLRREGDEAFYYHGPIRSTVTVGVFTEKDYVFSDTDDLGNARMITPRSSFALQQLRKKHPYNLVNGAGFKTRVRGQSEARLQPSLVVPIPD